MLPPRARRPGVLPLLLALGFALRLGFGWSHPPQGRGEELVNTDNYTELATSVARSWNLSIQGRPSAHREPVYPVLLGLMFKLFGRSYPVVLLTNCVLAALYFLFLAGRSLFGESTALLATAVCALYPPFIHYAAQPVRETALLAVNAGALWALLQAWEDPRARSWVWAGLAAALSALTNVTTLPFGLILAPAAVVWLNRRQAASAWRWSALYTAAFITLYALWPLRNALSLGAFIPGTTLAAGSICYSALIVPQESGGTQQETEILARDPVIQAAARLDAPRREALFRRACRDWVLQRPVGFLRLVAWRFFWDEWRLWPRPQAAGTHYRLFRWVGLLSNGWIIPLGLIGMLRFCTRPPRAICVSLFVFSIVLIHSLVLTMLRYRTPLMPWLILFACATLCRGREFTSWKE